jgi:hypothetical protein
MRRSTGFLFGARSLLATASAVSIAATAGAQPSTYVGTLGRDTLSLEQVVRSPGSIVGDWISLYGGVMHHYEMTLRPDGTVSRYQLALHRLSGKVDGNLDLRLDGDSVVVRNAAGDEVRARVGAVFPTFTSTMGPIDLILTRARATGRDSSLTATVGAFGPYRRGGMPIVFFGGDSVRFGNPLAPLVARVDTLGNVLGMSARATTTRTETRRVPDFDVYAMAAHFPNVADSVRITGVPAISPRDTVRATIGAAAVGPGATDDRERARWASLRGPGACGSSVPAALVRPVAGDLSVNSYPVTLLHHELCRRGVRRVERHRALALANVRRGQSSAFYPCPL